MERAELFKKAGEEHKKKWSDQDDRRSGEGNTFTPLPYTALEKGRDKIVRLLGAPIAVRQKPTDPKLFMYSMLTGDNGKHFRCIYPTKQENPSWILWKIIDLVLDGSWEGDERKYKYRESHPSSFNIVHKNGLLPDSGARYRFETGWYPKKYVAMNVIDRHDLPWHQENKTAKLLSRNGSSNGDSVFYDPGISEYTYRRIWEQVVAYNGDWEDYDIAIRRTEATPFYETFHGVNDNAKIQESVRSLIIDGPLTDEEKGYSLFDLDKFFPVTSYSKIKARLGQKIRQIDAEFKKNFFEELSDLAAEEEKDRESTTEASTATATPGATLPPKNESQTPSEPSVEKPVRRRRPVSDTESSDDSIPWGQLADGSYNGVRYEGVPKMTDDQKAMVVSIKDDGTFSYVETWKGEPVELYELDSNPEFLTPAQFTVDPVTGQELPPVD